ncbi:hypothetical protein EI94DRAFT_595663 [Lactarius quietus]|nr:hypothetical protein EI94DRAFT_595663 [Lactarius quietus]
MLALSASVGLAALCRLTAAFAMAQIPHPSQTIFKDLHSMHCPPRFTLPWHYSRCSRRPRLLPATFTVISDTFLWSAADSRYEARAQKHHPRSPPSRRVS